MIKSEEVIKDEYGFWTHSQYPDFESEDIDEINDIFDKFRKQHNIKMKCVMFEDDAPDELNDKWFEDGCCDCREWEPTKPTDNAFLLSVHDTEYGPVAVFAIPVES